MKRPQRLLFSFDSDRLAVNDLLSDLDTESIFQSEKERLLFFLIVISSDRSMWFELSLNDC